MKKFLTVICALLLSAAAFAQTYDLDFAQTRRLKASGKTTLMKGHLTYDGKDHLDMQYSDPAGDFFTIDGNMVKMNLLGVKAEMDSEKVAMVKLQRATLLNCLSGNWEQAAKDIGELVGCKWSNHPLAMELGLAVYSYLESKCKAQSKTEVCM